MNRAAEIDRFYSVESPEEWRKILGPGLHYHFGVFDSRADSLETAQQRSVRNFYPAIPGRSSVLDAGCGWGGPANMLQEDLECDVTGVTISKAQAAYCKSIGIRTQLTDLEDFTPTATYDTGLLFESLEHIQNKSRLLKRLRICCETLLLRINCTHHTRPLMPQVAEGYLLLLETPAMITQRLEKAGWSVRSVTNRRPQSLQTNQIWYDRLIEHYPDREPPGHMKTLKDFCRHSLKHLPVWSAAHPLLDIEAH